MFVLFRMNFTEYYLPTNQIKDNFKYVIHKYNSTYRTIE